MASSFDWNRSATGDQKRAFHRVATKQLKKLAEELGFASSSYDIRSNKGGPAVSGEVTLHHHDLYVQATQSVMGPDRSLMIRTCENRQDFTGGRNQFAPLRWLDDGEMPKLVGLAKQVLEQKLGFDGDAADQGYNPHYSTPIFSK